MLLFLIPYILQIFSNVNASPLSDSISNANLNPSSQGYLNQSERAVLDIIWSCLSTIISCSWGTIHHNIPDRNRSLWKRTLQRVELMIWSIIAPEVIIFWAIKQRTGAQKLANMYKSHPNLDKWTETHWHFVQMGGFMLYKNGNPVSVLPPQRLGDFVNDNWINTPRITEEEISDRSKSDNLAKAFAIIHVTWFIAQVLIRMAQGLVDTNLELVTLALATLNAFMYYLWWKKPFNVETTVRIDLMGSGIQEINPVLPASHDGLAHQAWQILRYLIFPFRLYDIVKDYEIVNGQMCVNTFYAYSNVDITTPEDNGHLLVLAVFSAVFGIVHCAGWNFPFPSPIEVTIWRISSAMIVFIAMIWVAVFALNHLDLKYNFIPPFISPIILGAPFLGLIFYIPARLALLVGAIMQLRVPLQGGV